MGKLYNMDAEIFATGTWNGDKYSDADLEDMVKNFVLLASTVKPPIKMGHTPSIKGAGKPAFKGDGQPALGWVTAVKKQGNKLIATLSDIPEIVYKAIKTGRYKRVSPEVYWGYKDKASGTKHHRVLAGVALLGADIPAVSTLADLEAYLSQTSDDSDSFDKMAVYSFAETATEKIIDNNKEKIDMSDELKKEYDAKLKAKEAELDKKYTDDMGAKDKEIADMKQADTQRIEDTAKADLKAYCDDKVKAHLMTPAASEALQSEDAKLYSTPQALAAVKAYADAQEQAFDMTEKGSSEKKETFDDSGDAFDSKVKAYMREHKVKYTEAMDAVAEAEPVLFKAYMADSNGKDGE